MPGRYLCGFFTPPDGGETTCACGADFLAALLARCFLGALAPVFLRAVCFVRAILYFYLFDYIEMVLSVFFYRGISGL